jgi:hypothetical protein
MLRCLQAQLDAIQPTRPGIQGLDYMAAVRSHLSVRNLRPQILAHHTYIDKMQQDVPYQLPGKWNAVLMDSSIGILKHLEVCPKKHSCAPHNAA